MILFVRIDVFKGQSITLRQFNEQYFGLFTQIWGFVTKLITVLFVGTYPV